MIPKWVHSNNEATYNMISRDLQQRLIDAMAELLSVHDEECRFDHHGYCQEHGSLTEGPCYVAQAREVLAEAQADVERTGHTYEFKPDAEGGEIKP